MEMESLADQLASVSVEDAIERLMTKGIMERAINDAIKKVDEAVATLGVSKAALMVFWNVHLVGQITAYLPKKNIYGIEDEDDEDEVCRKAKCCSICGLSQFMPALNYLTADVYYCDEHNLTHCARCFESEAENKVCLFCSRSFCTECTTITCLNDNEHFICADHLGDLDTCTLCDRVECEQSCGSIDINECTQCGEIVCSDCTWCCGECDEYCCEECIPSCCHHCDENFCEDCATYDSDIDEWVCYGCASDPEDGSAEESDEGSD